MPRLEAVSTNIIRRIGVIQTGTGAGLTPEEKERIGLEIFEPGRESRPDSLAGRLHQLEQELDRIEREGDDYRQALSEISDDLDKISQEIASAREGRPSLLENIKDIRDLINSLLKKEWLSFEKRETFTAIAGQTEFVLTKFTYEPGSGHLWVFRNGVLQSPGEDRDYVEIDESTIQFNEPLEEGELITCVLCGSLIGFESKESFTAQEGQQEFVLSKFTYEPGSGRLWVFRNGVLQSEGDDQDYVEVNESTIRFNDSLEDGDLIVCVLFGKPGSGQQPGSSGGSLSDDLLIQNTINLAKTNFKLNAHIAATRERLSGLIIDVFSDTSGIDGSLSRGWGYDPERKEIHALADFVWEKSLTQNAPPARGGHSLTYDSTRGVIVLFGGLGGGTRNDTWEYDGTDWREINTPTKPPGRHLHSITYDAARGVVVLFGGEDSSYQSLNDTWEYDGTNWRQINTPTKPPARYRHSLTYDSARGVVVLFGGYNGSSHFNDTWEYDGTDWRQINTTTKPPTRSGHSLTYDSTRGVVVLFGGWNGPSRFNDTWEYDGTNWRRINTPTSPPARDRHSLTYDSARGVVVLFGGFGGSRLNDTWEYDGTDWREINTPTKPGGRDYHSLTYDSARGVVVLFGGDGSGGGNDTWEYYDNTSPAEVVSSDDILDSRPSYIYFVSHTPEDVSDASIQYQMSLDDGKTWFSVSPEEFIQVKSNINSSDPPIIRVKAIISPGGRLSGWAYGWV